MRMISTLALGALLSLGLASGVSAQALNANDAGLSNIQIGVGTGNRGNAGLTNSASLAGGRVSAQTQSTNAFRNDTVVGGNGISPGQNGVGSAAGFTETTFLRGGGVAEANTSLNGTLPVNASFLNARNTSDGNLVANNNNGGVSNYNLNGSGVLNGAITRTANSYAGAGLQGYSGAQISNGPGSVSNRTDGAAFGVGVAVTGGAGLTGGAGMTGK